MAQVNRSFEFGDPPGVGIEWDRLVQSEGYDLSKFELVAVPEEFSDASGTDQIGHGGLLDYDGVIDVEGNDSDGSCVDPAEGFDVTIEHVGDDLNPGSGLVHLLEVPSHQSETKPYHKDDILDVGIEACDLKSLLEQFEEIEQPPKDPRLAPQAAQPQPAPVPQPVPPPEVQPAQKEPTRYKIITPMKDLPNPADVVKKIAPVKRKGAILLDPEALPFKRVKPKPVSQNPEVNKAIHLARSTHAASPIPFNLKNLIPAPKYLSMEHDYCMSPTPSEKSTTSDQPSQMSKEQRRAYYKYKYRVKKKMDGVDSPSKCSSVSSSPISMSPASLSPNPSVVEVNDGKEPSADMPKPAAVVPLFDKIPGYFSKKLLVGMYREIDSEKPSKPVHQGYDQNIFVSNEKGDGGKKSASKPVTERKSRQQVRRSRRRSYRQSRRKNSLSSQSDSSYCSSCSEHSDREGADQGTPARNRNTPVRRRRRTRDSICSARSRDSRSRDSRSPSYSRSRSRSASYSSYSDRGSIRSARSYSRSRSRSFSRSRSRSYSRSPSYSRSWSRSRSQSFSRSRSRSRSRSPIDYRRRSRSYSRSISRSPERTRRSSSRRLSRSTHSRSRGRSISRSRSRSRVYSRSRNNNRSDSRIRTFHPVDSKEVKYTQDQLKEFEERRVMYVGNIARDTKRIDLEKQFQRFGPVEKIQLYFRDDQDNYGFVTFRYKCDAVAAITSGHDPNWPKYDLCFGGRRKFCQNKYQDLDSLKGASTELDFGYNGRVEENVGDSEEPQESEFDRLLKAAMKGSKKR